MANRYSQYSNSSTPVGAARSAAQQSTQVSTTTLLNTLHTIYTSGQTYQLDASTSLAINTWLTAANPETQEGFGGTFDGELCRTAWEHARRRAEDSCIVLGYTVPPCPATRTKHADSFLIGHYINRPRPYSLLSFPPYRCLPRRSL